MLGHKNLLANVTETMNVTFECYNICSLVCVHVCMYVCVMGMCTLYIIPRVHNIYIERVNIYFMYS